MLAHALESDSPFQQYGTVIQVLDQSVPGRLRLHVFDVANGEDLCHYLQQHQNVFHVYWQADSQSLLLQFHPQLQHRKLVDEINRYISKNRQRFMPSPDTFLVSREGEQSREEKTFAILADVASYDDVKPYQAWAVFHQLVRSQLQTSLTLTQTKRLLLHSLRPNYLQAISHALRQRLLILEQPCRVTRQGKEVYLNWQDVDLGDHIHFEAGDRLPLDGCLQNSNHLLVDEHLATGFVQSSSKQHQHHLSETLPVDDRSNMVWAGSDILSGSGEAVVTARGLHTQMFKMLAQQMLAEPS